MAIINRIARLFKADVHAVLDQIEEPELLLKQSIREMQSEFDATERNLLNAKQHAKQCEQRLNELKKSIEDISDEIELCLSNENEDLARNLIRRRIELQRIVAMQSKAAQRYQDQAAELLKLKQEQHSLLSDMQQKAALLCDKTNLIGSQFDCQSIGAKGAKDAEFAVSESDIEVALLKEKRRLAS